MNNLLNAISILIEKIVPEDPDFISKLDLESLPYDVSLSAFIHNPYCIKYIPEKYVTKNLFLNAYYFNYDYMILDYLPERLMEPSIYLEIFEDSPEKIEFLDINRINDKVLSEVLKKLGKSSRIK